MKQKKEAAIPFEIVGLIDSPRWYKLKCVCAQDPEDVLNKYPIKNCLSCKFQTAQDSMPKKAFTVSHQELDKNKKPIGTITRVIKKITIVRGDCYQEIRGWVF